MPERYLRARKNLFPSQRLFDKAEIKYLARRNLFGYGQTFLGESDGAAHPPVIQIVQSAQPAEMKIVDFAGQGEIFDAEILGNDVDRFRAMLRVVLQAL